MTNKTELFIQKIDYIDGDIQFQDTYLAPSIYGTQLGLEFTADVTDRLFVGQIITIDKTNKSINPWVDGTASIIGITGSSIYPAPGTLVFTDRPLQLPISFTPNENGLLLFDPIPQYTWEQLDLSDNVAFPITFNIADVRQINDRNAAYSKTITIPGTKNNNTQFENIFDIQSISSYDTRIKVKASVVVDSIPVLEGYLQLNSIKCDDNNNWFYDCIIFGENANFSKIIDQNAKLQDLDFSEFDHDLTIGSITQSWSGDYQDGYYYPYIDFNTGKRPLPISSAISNGVSVTDFKPAIYTKQYLDKIFKIYGYTYESEFLNSELFRNLIIPCNKITLENDDLWRFNSSFKGGITSSIDYSSGPGVNFYDIQSPGVVGVLNSVSNQFNTVNNVNFSWTLSTSGSFFYDLNSLIIDPVGAAFYYKNTYLTQYEKKQKVILNLDFEIIKSGGLSNNLAGCGFTFFYKTFLNNVQVDVGSITSIGVPGNTIGGLFVENEIGEIQGTNIELLQRKRFEIVYENDNLDPNDEVKFTLGVLYYPSDVQNSTNYTNFENSSFNLRFYPTTNGVDGTYFYNVIDPILIRNQPFKINGSIPQNVRQIDFINDIIKMFNLYLYQDKIDPKKIYIEPRDEFYTTTQLDWSRKLDTSRQIAQMPIVDRKKRVIMSYKDDKDLFNSDYKGNYSEVYGQYEYDTGNEITTSEQKIQLNFSPSPLAMFKQSNGLYDNRVIYTQILDPQGNIGAENSGKIEHNVRILLRKTLTLGDGTQFAVGSKRFGLISQSTLDYLGPLFPYAGHLDNPFDPTFDLNFGRPIDLYFLIINGYPVNNIYTEYYEQFFEEIYGPESKSISCYVYLTSQDLLDFDYRKLIYFDNLSSGAPGYYRVNKIEYDPFVKQSYKVELIKVLNNFKSSFDSRKGPGKGPDIKLPDWTNGVESVGNNDTGNGNVILGLDNSVKSNFNVVNGSGNVIDKPVGSIGGSIVNGLNNTTRSDNSIVVATNNSNAYGTARYGAIVGGASHSLSGCSSVILGGERNVTGLYSSVNNILGGCRNEIGSNPTGTTSVSFVNNSFILGGLCNSIQVGTTLSNTQNTFIVGGQNNTIASGVTNSFILNGNGITVTQSNTVYIDGTLIVNGTPITGGGSQGPTGPTGPTGDPLFEEIVIGNRHYIQLISATPSTDFYYLGSDASVCDKPFTGLIIMTAANPTFTGFIVDNAGKNLISNSLTNVDILGTSNNVTGDRSTFISSKRSDIVGTSDFGSIISSQYGCIRNSNKSSIISSNGYSSAYTSCISSSKYSNISTHFRGHIYSSCYASIIAGSKNEICNSDTSVILGSKSSTICLTYAGSIIGGVANLSKCGLFSSIVGGYSNCVYISYSAGILAGQGNKVYTNSNQSTIVGGYQNTIDCSSGSSIIGGGNNFMCSTVGPNNSLSIISSATSYLGYCSINSTIISSVGSTMSCSQRSVILGGSNLILNTQDDTVLVPNLWIAGSLSPDSGVTNGLTQDVSVSGTTFSFCNGILTAVIV